MMLYPKQLQKQLFTFALLIDATKQPQEYVRPGMRMLFRDGRVRGVGLVTAIPTVQPAH